jgi:hypothetical protein
VTDRHVSRALALLRHTAFGCLMAIGFWTWIWNGVPW